MNTLEMISNQLNSTIQSIDSDLNDTTNYSKLQELIILSLPHLEKKKDTESSSRHDISGRIGNEYIINYYNREGVSTVTVEDIRDIANKKSRSYSVRSNGDKAPKYASIREVYYDNRPDVNVFDTKFIGNS